MKYGITGMTDPSVLASLTLTNFRDFTQLKLSQLAGVNLIGGVNNAGKTAILEAIFLLFQRDSGMINRLPSLFRARTDVDDQRYFWNWLAKDCSPEKVTAILGDVPALGRLATYWYTQAYRPQGSVGGLGQYGDRFLGATALANAEWRKLPGVKVFSPHPTSPVEDAQVFTKGLQKSLDNEEHIEALLHDVDPRVKRIRSLSDAQTSKPLLHIGLNSGETFPATQFGQGFNRLLRIYSELLASEAKVFLIDEIETGLHHSVLETVWKGLATLARREGVQIFATTHSRETILAAHKVFSAESAYDFAYHRLERDADGEVRAVTYDQEALAGADESNFEVR